jgi:hypothetical protein
VTRTFRLRVCFESHQHNGRARIHTPYEPRQPMGADALERLAIGDVECQ